MSGRLRRLCLLALLPVTALTACQPEAAETQVAAVPEPARLPDCAALTDAELGANGIADCQLTSPGGAGVRAEVTYAEGAEGALEVSLKIAAADGTEIQTIREMAQSAYGAPAFVDLDSDGRAELLVPLMTGNVNTSFAVWRGKDGAPDFERAGEVGGIEVSAYEPGMFVTPARGSAASWYTSYHVFAGNQIRPVATAETILAEADGADDTCTVIDDGGLADLGLSVEAAQAKFCAVE